MSWPLSSSATRASSSGTASRSPWGDGLASSPAGSSRARLETSKSHDCSAFTSGWRSNNFICRQLPASGSPCFFIAGASGISFRRFLLIDGTAALVTANVFTWLGYHYAEDLGNVIAGLGRFRQVMTGVLVLAIGLVAYRVILYQIERRQVKREEREGRAGHEE